MQFFNFTPFVADHTILTDKDGAEILLVIAKATYKINTDSMLELAKDQVEVFMEDQYFGDIGLSSIKYESDLALFKPALDVVLVGHAWNSDPKAGYVDVSLKFNDHTKTVRVFGDRYFRKKSDGYSITKPKPFEKIPLRYELAFGGEDDSVSGKPPEFEPNNPIGRGFNAEKSKKKVNGKILPNLEDPVSLIQKPGDTPFPSCFGFVSRNWEPRKSYAGDYGVDWQKTRMPLLPEDFDPRYYNAGSQGLVLEGYAKGGEKIAIRNATRKGSLQFVIPRIKLEAVVGINDEYEVKDINFDTIIIDADEESLILVGRNNFNVHNKIFDIQFIKVQYKPED